MNYYDVQKDAALLNSHWDLGGNEGQEEGAELIHLMREVERPGAHEPGHQTGARRQGAEGLMDILEGDALEFITNTDDKFDLVVTDPPYAFGGSGDEHAISATVAIVLRETAKLVKRGSWMLVFCASSWRSTSYMIESVRGIVEPVRFGTWAKPKSRTKVRTPGWLWASVTVIAFRKGPENRPDLPEPCGLDHITAAPIIKGRRAELPPEVCTWAVEPFCIPNGLFIDPFAGSGALVKAATTAGMQAYGIEKNPVKKT